MCRERGGAKEVQAEAYVTPSGMKELESSWRILPWLVHREQRGTFSVERLIKFSRFCLRRTKQK